MVCRRCDDGLTGCSGALDGVCGTPMGVRGYGRSHASVDTPTTRSTPRAVKSAGVVAWAMSADLVPPGERECVRCGRREAWDEDVATWAVDGEAVGEVHCVHEWDINGTYSPFR